MPLSHNVVDHIAAFTSFRDIDLLEVSLLKSTYNILTPSELKLLKLDNSNQPVKQVNYQNGEPEVIYDEIEVSGTIIQAVEYMDSADIREYSSSANGLFYTIILLHNSQSYASYLIVINKEQLSEAGSFIVSGMIQVYQNFSDLLIESQTDELTGLANRKTFDQMISKVYDEILFNDPDDYPDEQRELATSMFWLAIVDIDHFKQVNDTFGHIYGDEVLVLLANIMKESFRENDLIFRFGGEEFVVILRAPDQEACSNALERFREKVQDTDIPRVGNITVSLGYVKMLKSIFHMTLLSYADQALYFSKDNGRNRATFFDDIVETGDAQLESLDIGDIDLF